MAEINLELIKDKINEIKDSDLNVSLGDYGALEELILKDNIIQVYLNLVQPIQWVYSDIKQKVEDVLKENAPSSSYEIFINEMKQNKKGNVLTNVKNIIAVASGKGGVGKSAIASNLAAALSITGAKVGIIDGDVYGPSQPTMYGVEGQQLQAKQTADGKTIAIPLEKYGIHIASMGFIMSKEQAAIVRGPMLAGYFSMLFEQIEWPPLDFLIFDLPPGTGDIQLTLTQKIPLTGAVVVTTPQEISVADVRRSVAMFKKVKVDVIGIVENMSYFIPPDMPDKKYFIFGEGGGEKVAQETGVDLLAKIPLDQSMREGNDSGMPVVLNKEMKAHADKLKEMASRVVKGVRKINYDSLSTATPEISL